MATKLAISIILVCTFGISFIVATAVFDTLARERGFYAEGIQEASEVGK